MDLLREQFTKENILAEIRRSGIFVLQYRLMINGRLNRVLLKAVMLNEKDGQQLIIGISNIESRFGAEGI